MTQLKIDLKEIVDSQKREVWVIFELQIHWMLPFKGRNFRHFHFLSSSSSISFILDGLQRALFQPFFDI